MEQPESKNYSIQICSDVFSTEEKRKRNNRGSLHAMGFSNFSVHKKHWGACYKIIFSAAIPRDPILCSELGLGILHFHQALQVILMQVFPLTFHFKNSQALGKF